jgi:hypothetical protein
MLLRIATGALMVRLAVLFTPEKEAVSITAVVALTLPAATEKLADWAPWGIVTEEGTLAAAGFELDSNTRAPPLPAGAVKLTVPEPDWPLVIWLGAREILLSPGDGGLIVTLAVRLRPE